jgi:perosamine synthetase
VASKSVPYLPYGRHLVDDADVAAVTDTLRGDWLTTGPTISQLERAFAGVFRASECVAVSSGTAALHCAVAALGIEPCDEVIPPAITFVATGNAVVYQGGTPVFADVDPARSRATYPSEPNSRAADISVFSLHPIEHVTAGEGGIVACESTELAARMRRFRNHGIDHDQGERQLRATYAYHMVELEFNYRLTPGLKHHWHSAG